jgi:hypothetical protein
MRGRRAIACALAGVALIVLAGRIGWEWGASQEPDRRLAQSATSPLGRHSALVYVCSQSTGGSYLSSSNWDKEWTELHLESGSMMPIVVSDRGSLGRLSWLRGAAITWERDGTVINLRDDAIGATWSLRIEPW